MSADREEKHIRQRAGRELAGSDKPDIEEGEPAPLSAAVPDVIRMRPVKS